MVAMLLGPCLVAAASTGGAHPLSIEGVHSPDASVVNFTSSYRLLDVNFNIIGYEPAGEGSFPLYVFAGGAGQTTDFDEYNLELPFAHEMALRGFAAAIIGFPGDRHTAGEDDDPNLSPDNICEGRDTSFSVIARGMYAYDGPDDEESTSALATLCRRASVDCSLGIAVHGISLGGFLSNLAPRFAHGVTASLTWSAGTFVAGGDSCCGRFSGNLSCCEGDDPIVGGEPLECMRDVELSRYLPRSRRRLIIGAHDAYYGDCGLPLDRSPDRVCDRTEHGALVQCRLGTGYDCGERNDCIQPDGSGYYVPTPTQVGGNASDPMQSHVFHHFLTGVRNSTGMNKAFVFAEEPWGMQPNLVWLAATARLPLPL